MNLTKSLPPPAAPGFAGYAHTVIIVAMMDRQATQRGRPRRSAWRIEALRQNLDMHGLWPILVAVGLMACESGAKRTGANDKGPADDGLQDAVEVGLDATTEDKTLDPGIGETLDDGGEPVGDLAWEPSPDNQVSDEGSEVDAPYDTTRDSLPPPTCDDPVAFSPGPYGISPYEVAPPFTLPTTDGVFDFETSWTGCDSHFFIQHAAGYAYSEGLWKSNPRWLFEESPPNARFFFLSFDSTAEADVGAMQASVEAALEKLPPAEATWWAGRIHFVPVPARQIEGFVGDVLRARGYFAFAIDRFQRMREVGLLMNIAWDSVNPQLMYLANEVRAYNFEREREARLEAETATLLTVFDRVVTQGHQNYAQVAFPDSFAMSRYDSLEVDLFMDCGDPASCEWDYLAHLYLCDTEDPERCDTEIARWVTTYGRDGRWVTDISPMLAFVQDGGVRRLRFDSSSQSYLTTMRLRLLNRGKGMRPVQALPLFRGSAAFDLAYNSLWAPIEFNVPEGTQRVEIAALITGHGFGHDQANCAEFCNHTHHFRVNEGPDRVKEHPMAGTLFGCQDQVPDGVVPNQYGTWSLGRGGWCPGFDVRWWVIDISGDVVPGQTQTVTYRALYQGQEYDPKPIPQPTGFPARIEITSYVVFWNST